MIHSNASIRISFPFRGIDSVNGLLYQIDDQGLFLGSQCHDGKRTGPHVSLIDLRDVVEAEYRVPCFELFRGLEIADDLTVLRVCRYPVPGFRPEFRDGFRNEDMYPFGYRRDIIVEPGQRYFDESMKLVSGIQVDHHKLIARYSEEELVIIESFMNGLSANMTERAKRIESKL
jgi:hypothetical protein